MKKVALLAAAAVADVCWSSPGGITVKVQLQSDRIRVDASGPAQWVGIGVPQSVSFDEMAGGNFVVGGQGSIYDRARKQAGNGQPDTPETGDMVAGSGMASAVGGTTSINFSRLLNPGGGLNPINPNAPFRLLWALGSISGPATSFNSFQYHGNNRGSFMVDFSKQNCGTTTPVTQAPAQTNMMAGNTMQGKSNSMQGNTMMPSNTMMPGNSMSGNNMQGGNMMAPPVAKAPTAQQAPPLPKQAPPMMGPSGPQMMAPMMPSGPDVCYSSAKGITVHVSKKGNAIHVEASGNQDWVGIGVPKAVSFDEMSGGNFVVGGGGVIHNRIRTLPGNGEPDVHAVTPTPGTGDVVPNSGSVTTKNGNTTLIFDRPLTPPGENPIDPTKPFRLLWAIGKIQGAPTTLDNFQYHGNNRGSFMVDFTKGNCGTPAAGKAGKGKGKGKNGKKGKKH